MDDDNRSNDRELNKAMMRLKSGYIADNLYEMVCRNREYFQKRRITSEMIKNIMDLKAMQAFGPDPLSYSILEQERVDYIYENIDNPVINLMDDNEKRFKDAIIAYYAVRDEYEEKTDYLCKLVNDQQDMPKNRAFQKQAEEREAGLLTDILFGKFSIMSTTEPYSVIGPMFEKCDLNDAYNMDDNGVAFRWKAGKALESKGLLSQGMIDKIMVDAGFSIDDIKASLNRYKIDRMRVWNVRFSPLCKGLGESVCCEIDGEEQEARILPNKDVKLKSLLTDEKGLAIRLYKDVLDSTREKNQWVSDEKILERVSMPYMERLLDIYRNGMTKEDIMLMNKVIDTQQSVDSFWEENNLGLNEFSIEQQKRLSFLTLVDYLSDLRPGMLSDEEVLRLIEVEPRGCIEGEGLEYNLMRLPDSFFPLVEQSGKYDYVLDYVKSIRGTGRITPKMAFSSMDHYLYHLTDVVWDPEGVDDEFGRVTGGYLRRDCHLINPLENFPPNLLSEKQWEKLKENNPGVTNADLPYGAFKRNRVTDVQIYPYRDGSMAIRCKIDNEQQESRLLSDIDARDYDDRTNKRELAVSYFMDVFAREPERSAALTR